MVRLPSPSAATIPRPPLLTHTPTPGQWASYRLFAHSLPYTPQSPLDPRVVALTGKYRLEEGLLNVLNRAGLGGDKTYAFLNAVAQMRIDEERGFKALPGAFLALTASGLGATEACDYLITIVNQARYGAVAVFESLPRVLPTLARLGLSPADARSRLASFVHKLGFSIHTVHMYSYLDTIFSERLTTLLTSSGLTNAEAHDYVMGIVEKTGLSADRTLLAFPNVYTTLIDSGLSPAGARAYLMAIADKTRSGAKYVFDELSFTLAMLTSYSPGPADARTTLMVIANKVRDGTYLLLHNLSHCLTQLTALGLTNAQALSHLMTIVDKAGPGTAPVTSHFFVPGILSGDSATAVDRTVFLSHYMRVLKACTGYNIGEVMAAFRALTREIAQAPVAVILSYVELAATVMERHPRIGFNVLEGMVDAIKQDILPKDAAPDQAAILHVVDRSHGFVPVIYYKYQRHGDLAFAELYAHARGVIHEKMSLQDVQNIVREYGGNYAYLLAVIRYASPISGATYVEISKQIDLLIKTMTAGDLRDHIPAVWQKQVKSFAIESGEYRLKQGATLDPQGYIKTLMQHLQAEPRTLASSKRVQELQRELDMHLIAYIQAGSEGKAAAMQGVQQALYALASSREPIRVQLGMVDDLDYTTLTLLEQLFTDKDNIPVLLQTEVNRITALAHRDKPIVNIPGLARQLMQLWTQDASAEDRRVRISSTLLGYRVADLQALARHPAMAPEVQEMVNDLAHQTSAVRPEQIAPNLVDAILNDALAVIRGERDKFHYVKTAQSTVGIRPVKGPAFGLYGLTSGVCTAEDMVAWKNPDYKLFAITREDRDQAVGYVQAFEVRERGKRYLTLPGINPSTEFLGTVQASALYPKLMAQIASFAKEADYDAVLIPTAPLVHSNRTSISKAILRAGYPIHTFEKPVQWNSVRGHDFSEAYIAWVRGPAHRAGHPGPHPH